jgi:hypothetical protein
MNKDRSFLAVVGQLDPDEHPQVAEFVKKAQERVDKKRARDAERRDRGRRFVEDWFKTRPCIDCGCNDVQVLEADHVRGEILRSAKIYGVR